MTVWSHPGYLENFIFADNVRTPTWLVMATAKLFRCDDPAFDNA
jgi:hypothetical protein